MGKFLKIVFITLLILLVLFSILADLPAGKALLGHLDLALHLKLVSLLGMVIALFVSMGYKHRVDVSQKYRRAKQVLEEAEVKAERQKKVLVQMEADLKSSYAKKEQGLNSQIREAQIGYESRLKALTQKNVELKEALAKTMGALKRARQSRS